MSDLILSISIVSHGHAQHVQQLLEDLVHCAPANAEVILTHNLPEQISLPPKLPFAIKQVHNPAPKGFAANHNHAFSLSRGAYFVILNPDVRLPENPFPQLLALFAHHPKALAAPLIVNQHGMVEDSARNFPTPLLLMKKAAGKLFRFRLAQDQVPAKDDWLMPDWVAGMFIMAPRAVYEHLRGLNEHYFLYYEDVDFCARARLAGCDILVNRNVRVVHEAQRDSHKKARYLLWHMKSALKFFTSQAYLRISWRRLTGAL
ncbi:glycosyltransferase [Massilia sp. W12]|uniref:glycosyltransferase n=1 Tax=Massilia sp. W12 TaxID=3126507 RepID=UPI0030D225F9